MSTSTSTSCDAGDFLKKTPEFAGHNQYWYSRDTVIALVSAALELSARGGGGTGSGRIAFVSTPSLYFSLPPHQRTNHSVLDIDEQWASDEGFISFDFNKGVAGLPAKALGVFNVVVVDPPFITEPVWRAYAAACHALLAPNGTVVLTTVAENASLLAELFPGAARTPFQPSIPHLVYQYDTFCSADQLPAALAVKNKEIPE